MYRQSPALARLPMALRLRDYVIFTPCHLDHHRQMEASVRQEQGQRKDSSNVTKATALHETMNGSARTDQDQAVDVTHWDGETELPIMETGTTDLHSACSSGDVEAVQQVLERGQSVNAQTRTGLTPLQCAAGCGHADVVGRLLTEGATVNLKGPGGRSAVFMAAENGHLDCVLALLDAGADVNVTSDKGLTPLCVSVLNNHTNIALKLLPLGKDSVNVCDCWNNLPLHHAVRNGNGPLVNGLLGTGSRKNVLNRNFESPVHIAVVVGNLEVLELLISAGCDVNLCESVGNVTPLHVAVNMHSDMDLFRPMLRLLLRGDCILNWRAFSTLETPLYRSLGLEKTGISWELLSHGADPNLASPFDITALHKGFQKANYQLVNLMLNCGINWKRERWLDRYDTSCRKEMTDLVQTWRHSVVPLQALCRIYVRNLLEENLELKLNQIALPQKVRDYILLRDLD